MPSLPFTTTYHIHSLQALSVFAKTLSGFLAPGDVVALDGPLGAGKTTLTQQLGKAFGLTESVNSPTFVLMHEYQSGPFPIAHVDLYRLGEDRAHTMADELFAIMDEGRTLVLVEWACYGEFLDAALTVAVRIEPDPDAVEARRITVSANRPLFDSPQLEAEA